VTVDSGVFDGEGPAKGYCTVKCTYLAGICEMFSMTGQPPAQCVYFDGQGYCLEGCEIGPPGLTQFDPNKCHGRTEVACAPINLTDIGYVGSACFPQCNTDADCGGGLSCNPKTGLCSNTVSTGLPLGSECSSPCAGKCATLFTSADEPFTTICTEQCTFGASPTCGWAGPGTGPAPAACLYPAFTSAFGETGFGDLGHCGQLCDCNQDCSSASLTCVPWTGPGADANEAFFQRKGYCGDPKAEGAGTLPCTP
jgi:hypothetical protein